jgi:hypothetical protein
MGTTVRSGSRAACLSVPGLGITGAGVMADTGVARVIGGAVDGVAQAGVMDMEDGATAAATLEDTLAAVSMVTAEAFTAAGAFTVEADSMAEVGPTEVVDTVGDIGN